MKVFLFLFVIVCCCLPAAASPVYVLDLSPLALRGCGTEEDAVRLWDTLYLASSLQGIVNRREPEIYLIFTGTENREDGSVDRFWLSVMQEGFIAGRKTAPVRDVFALVGLFRSRIKGLCVYDQNVPATANAAATAAGCEDLLCVRLDDSPDSVYTRLTRDMHLPVKRRLVNPDGSPLFTGKGTVPETDIPSTGSAKCDVYLWAKAKYLDTGKCSPEVLGYYPDAFWLKARRGRPSSCCLGNRDFIIAEKGFCFDLSPWEDEAPNDDPLQRPGTDAETLTLILDACNRRTEGKKPIMVCGFLPWDIKYSAEAGGRHQVVEGEWKLAETLSLRNAYMDADAVNYAGMCNASFFSKEPLKKYYPQKARGRDGAVLEDKCYVCFYAGDYDSAAWMYQNLPALWNDPERGKEPMCWGFDPNLARRFAAGFAYIRRTAASADYFVGGDSGAGYINPGFLAAPRASGLPSGTEAWKKHCLRLYRQFGLSVTGFLLEGNAPPMAPEVWEALREFSPGGAAGMYMPGTGLYKDMPFVRIQYDLIRFDKTKKEEYVREFVRLSREKSPCFILARHILWSPSEQKEFMEALKEAGDFEQTDIFTFMGLVKQFEEGGGVYRPKDLFDCRRITVESHSPLFDGCDARDAFGGRFGTRENGGILFADTGEDEYTLEWSAPEAPEHVSVTLEADGSGERQAEKAVLLGDAGDGFFAVVSASPKEYGRVTLEGDAKGARRFRLILTKRKENRLAPRIKHISAWRDR